MRLHLLDGTYELFRSHFSPFPDRLSPEGQPVKATVGVMAAVLGLLHDADEQVTHLGVAFDNPIRSFRNDLYPPYKSEAGVPPELLAQFDLVEEAVAALGVVVWSMDEWEADDALATAAARWSAEVDQVRILTPDKDLGQCVLGDQVVQVDRRAKHRAVYDDAGVATKFGVPPSSIADYLALVGDAADGFPGLPGFGAKTAAAVLRKYGTIEQIPVDGMWGLNVRGSETLRATLRERWRDALLFKQLAQLVLDVPLPQSLDDLEWQGVPQARFLEVCDRLGVTDLRTRPRRWATA